MKTKRVVILPIQEPGASMIADGKKKYEFRSGTPKGKEGQEIWIVATGKAKKPREIIAKTGFGSPGLVGEIEDPGDEMELGARYTYLFGELKEDVKIYEDDLLKIGGKPGDIAIELLNTKKVKPFTLESIGINRTPQKYQYLEVPNE